MGKVMIYRQRRFDHLMKKKLSYKKMFLPDLLHIYIAYVCIMSQERKFIFRQEILLRVLIIIHQPMENLLSVRKRRRENMNGSIIVLVISIFVLYFQTIFDKNEEREYILCTNKVDYDSHNK